jgi:hypothetical protein
MKAALASCELECAGWLIGFRARGSPLPQQGEGEGEALSEATCAASEAPHLSPLPFSEGRGEKGHVRFGTNLGSHNADGRNDAARLASNKCQEE